MRLVKITLVVLLALGLTAVLLVSLRVGAAPTLDVRVSGPAIGRRTEVVVSAKAPGPRRPPRRARAGGPQARRGRADPPPARAVGLLRAPHRDRRDARRRGARHPARPQGRRGDRARRRREGTHMAPPSGPDGQGAAAAR